MLHAAPVAYPARLAGLHAALMTPYDADGEVSGSCLEALIGFVLDQGIGGLYVGGSTGEALLQTTEERELVLRAAADAGAGRCALIGQVGSIATREACHLAKVCASAGYDAVSAIPPIYFQHSKAGIKSYYEAILDAAGRLPLILYNIPAMSGVTFTLADFDVLLALRGVIGVKQTAIDMYQMEQLRRRHPGMLLLNGYDEMLLAGLVSGANGGIGSTYNIMGGRYLELLRRVRTGDVPGALEIQSRCNVVIGALVRHGVFPALKYVLCKLGVVQTPLCRAPLDTLRGGVDELDALVPTLEVAMERTGAKSTLRDSA